MIFYCTTLINNYHKIGISSSLSGVKKRLTTYRSAAPTLGQDTLNVLTTVLGYSPDTVERLRSEGQVGARTAVVTPR